MTQPLSACEFCEIIAGRSPASVVHRDQDCIAFMDLRPVTSGHLLVVPIEHATHLADLDPAEGGRLFALAQRLAAAIRRSDLKPAGINFHLADGEAAGQEIFHVHLHVIPRFPADGFGLRLPAGYGPHADRARLDRDAATIATALNALQHPDERRTTSAERQRSNP
jgi:diadenosine tetraphosphate (Ap4A) HIT family hydrolase